MYIAPSSTSNLSYSANAQIVEFDFEENMFYPQAPS